MESTKVRSTVVAVAASLGAVYSPATSGQIPATSCPADSGYLLSMQHDSTDRVMGLFYIKKMEALSINGKGKVDRDQGNTIDAASLQLNTYLRGTTVEGKKEIYWIQDTVTFVYSKKGSKEYLSSEAYKFNSTDSEELVMSSAKGKGSIFSSGSCTESPSDADVKKGKTYIYATNNLPAAIPQYGFMSMNEHLDKGRIEINVKYWDGNYRKIDTYDRISLGREGEFYKAHFVSNNILDTEFGFGGDGCGSTAYFIKMNAYLGMYFYGKGGYTNLRYMDGNTSTAEESANLECRYRYKDSMEEFLRDRSEDRKMLGLAEKLYDKDVLRDR